MMKTFLRKIGVGILVFTLVSSVAVAAAGPQTGTAPNHIFDGFGGCNKDATWCWNIDINPPFNKHNPQPIELYGSRAKKLIAQGEIFQAELSPYGVFYLGVHSYRYRREFNCTVNVTRRSYHCITSQ